MISFIWKKTSPKTAIIVVMLASGSMISVPDSFATQCLIPPLGVVYERSEHVFHGKAIDKNYLTIDLKSPIVTFEILESFKGGASGQISVTAEERWDYVFEEGFEYVVFAYRDGLSLKTTFCWPKFHAFPSTMQLVKKLTMPDSEIHNWHPYVVHESLSSHEKEQRDEIKKIIKEKRLERWDDVVIQRQMVTLAAALIIPVAGGGTVFIYFRRRKRKLE